VALQRRVKIPNKWASAPRYFQHLRGLTHFTQNYGNTTNTALLNRVLLLAVTT
jgi:hypothetical protein